jgi:hypothetical protein
LQLSLTTGCGTDKRAKVSAVVDTPCVDPQPKRSAAVMNNIIYIVGAVVIVLFILSFVGIV